MEKQLTDLDLRKNKYPIDVLIKNFNYVSNTALLLYQTLDADFCKKYILNEAYQTVEESYKIDIEYVLKRQPHLTYKDLVD